MDDFTKTVDEQPKDEQPRDEFREELHRALESTHRQHMAQNTLGIERSSKKDGSRYSFFRKYMLLILIGSIIYYIWSHKNKQMRQKKDN